jgi:poly-beta-1,6-N-acetyl-D-glucosamine synthase
VELLFWFCVAVIGYTYIFYPVIIASVARLRAESSSKGSTPTRASVVLVVRNEEKRIRARIQNLCDQEPQGIVDEIVVVSDGSDDSTCSVVEEIIRIEPRVQLVRQPVPMGKAAGVNAGVSVAKNDHIVFADARQDFRRDAVRRLLDRFADSEVGAVAGELRFRDKAESGHVAESVGMYWRFEVWIRNNEARLDSVIGCPGSIYAARREFVQPMPQGTILDDVWTPMHVAKQGKRVAYEGMAVAEDDPSNSLDREFTRKVRTLAGNFQLIGLAPWLLSPLHNRLWWMFVSHKVMRLLVPYALIGALITNIMLPGVWYGLSLATQILLYAAGLWGYVKGQTADACRVCNVVKVFLTINMAAIVGAAYALTGCSHKLWQTPTKIETR